MKKILDAFPAFSSLFFLVYISINPESLGPIIGFVASTFLFAYQQYLFRTEQPDIMAELKQLRSDMDSKVSSIQDKANAEVKAIRDDIAKFSITMARVPGIVEKPKDRPQVKF